MASFITVRSNAENIGSLRKLDDQKFWIYHMIMVPNRFSATNSDMKMLYIYSNDFDKTEKYSGKDYVVSSSPVSSATAALISICQEIVKKESENNYVVGGIAESNLIINYCKRTTKGLVNEANYEIKRSSGNMPANDKVVNIEDIRQKEMPVFENLCAMTNSKNLEQLIKKLTLSLGIEVKIDPEDPAMVLAACARYIPD